MSQSRERNDLAAALLGRSFVHPVFDYLLIGGGLSLIVTVLLLTHQRGSNLVSPLVLPYLFLLSNSAHFAASSVRLYTKPNARESLPFVTMALPLVAIGVLTLCMFEADQLGPSLNALYLSWSPYHYAAQAYGLAVMYSYRSGCLLQSVEKRLLWWTSMIPFFYVTIAHQETGLGWILPQTIYEIPAVFNTLKMAGYGLLCLAVVAPLVVFAKVWRGASGPMPLISLMMLVANSIWWLVLTPINAFFWATIFHGLQYLAIVIIFHLKDHLGRAENRHSRLYHVVWFYSVSVLLGYGLFYCFPQAYMFAGFGAVESMLLVVAVINIHHFIVDAYIWRLNRSDTNRRIVDERTPVVA